ncbi:MAG: protein translocase subunit SecF [Candidatus Eisenbacteria bacterium]|nr:protein translocase subunit SecF [Candidatus Eisenbacteria bacterium]
MFQLFKETHIGFMGARKYAYAFSAILFVATIVTLVARGGPRMGVDFTGGTVIEAVLTPNEPADRVRSALDKAGIRQAEIQRVGTAGDYLFRFQQTGATKDPFVSIKTAIQNEMPGTEVVLKRADTVGPKIGKELRSKAIWAVLFALGGILIYVGLRYEFIFAVGAVISLFHDVIITLGVMTFLGREFTLTVLAALLTIAGYSINDTIVVFDRIREQSRLMRRESLKDVIDLSVNQTLSRTILTSFTVILTVIALLVLGGEVIRDFALCMLIGVGFGTYSSTYVASALALDIHGPAAKGMRR